jgi:hypothetical protein
MSSMMAREAVMAPSNSPAAFVADLIATKAAKAPANLSIVFVAEFPAFRIVWS